MARRLGGQSARLDGEPMCMGSAVHRDVIGDRSGTAWSCTCEGSDTYTCEGSDTYICEGSGTYTCEGSGTYTQLGSHLGKDDWVLVGVCLLARQRTVTEPPRGVCLPVLAPLACHQHAIGAGSDTRDLCAITARTMPVGRRPQHDRQTGTHTHIHGEVGDAEKSAIYRARISIPSISQQSQNRPHRKFRRPPPPCGIFW